MPGRTLLRSLRHRDFRLYYFGHLIALNRRWMQRVAQSWLVYRLIDSILMLGLVAFLGLLPVLLFGLLGGALAMVQALALALLTLGGWVQVWQVLVLPIVGFCFTTLVAAGNTLLQMSVRPPARGGAWHGSRSPSSA